MKEFITEVLKNAIPVVATAIATFFIASPKKLLKMLKACSDALLTLSRAELIRSGQKYIERKKVPIYAKDAYDKLYQAYHNLGGNGTMTELHEKVMKLPESDEKGNYE
ncbi:MAG: hypothetical protein MJ120_00140 [Clostridia bacterium]|nr:hypothetical protein [Clostridia bacterium]